MDKIIRIIAEELNIKASQVENTIKLIDEGNTIPFIARYRKEVTGGLSDETLRELGERLNYLRNLEQRKEEVIKSIEEQGKLTDEILQAVAISKTLAEVEDIYRPYKQKKKTRATVAKAKGLEPLADIIIAQTEKKDINEKSIGIIISLIDSLIISTSGTIATSLNLNYVWQILIGFALLMGLIFSLYEIVARILKRKCMKKWI